MSASRIVSRLSRNLPSLSFKSFKSKSIPPPISPPKQTSHPQVFTSAKRISATSRLPVELSCLVSLMPLHSAIASCRLTSILSADSQSWGLIPQGNSMPL